MVWGPHRRGNSQGGTSRGGISRGGCPREGTSQRGGPHRGGPHEGGPHRGSLRPSGTLGGGSMGRAWASGEEGCQHLGTAFRENRAGWRVTPGGKRVFSQHQPVSLHGREARLTVHPRGQGLAWRPGSPRSGQRRACVGVTQGFTVVGDARHRCL